jgi:hypothetical protein
VQVQKPGQLGVEVGLRGGAGADLSADSAALAAGADTLPEVLAVDAAVYLLLWLSVDPLDKQIISNPRSSAGARSSDLLVGFVMSNSEFIFCLMQPLVA